MSDEEKVYKPVRRARIPFTPKIVIVVLVILFLVAAAASSFFVVDQREQAVVLRFGKYDRTVGPGLHARLPFGLERSHTVATQLVQTLTFGYRSTDTTGTGLAGARSYDDESVMLTGDRREVALEVAGKLGIDTCFAELLPADKVAHLEQLLATKPAGTALAFVGDGINDAPVLKRADVGIAMGGLGSDAAIEAADVVLMDDQPSKIAMAVRIARRTLRIARQNVWFAIGIKVAILGLATVGLGTMWMAVFADVGVTVLAVLNAMRALRN